jgi:arylsulfatase
VSQTRRQFLQAASAGTAGLVLSPWVAPDGAAAERPNIVLIMADDMGFSDIGPYGSEIDTPTLDRLAAGGLRFSQFYNAARCCPTRASLMTGLYPHQAGVGGMMSDRGVPGYRGDLNDECVTIAEVLGQSGYGTYMAGKWHLTKRTAPATDDGKDNWPLQRGFDRFYGTIAGAGDYYNPATLTDGNTPVASVPDDYYYTEAIGDRAAGYIADHAQNDPESPFFLYTAFTAPHWPLHAPPGAIARYDGRYDAGWNALRKERYERLKQSGLIPDRWALPKRGTPVEGWPATPVPAWDDLGRQERRWYRRAMEVYAAQVELMDRGIGRIVSTLEHAGELDNTLLLFLSDNGGCAEQLSASWAGPETTRDGRSVTVEGKDTLPGPPDTFMSYEKGWANASNTPFRLYKHWTHEGGIASPLIAHWPEQILQGGGQIVREPSHLIDVMATAVDVSGACYPDRYDGHDIRPMEGRSLRPVFRGDSISRTTPIFWEHERNRAVREGKWKLVSAAGGSSWALFDMEADRTETNDRADEHPERVTQMAERYDRWAKRTHVVPRSPEKE